MQALDKIYAWYIYIYNNVGREMNNGTLKDLKDRFIFEMKQIAEIFLDRSGIGLRVVNEMLVNVIKL